MKRLAARWSAVCALWLGLLAAVQSAPAGGIEQFTLTRAIPADACMAVHGRYHDGLKFLDEQFGRVWRAFEEQHFEKDLQKLFRSLNEESGGTAEEFDAHWQKMNDLFTSVDWATLARREFAFTMKIEFPAIQFAFLMIPSEGKVDSNFESLSGLAKTLVGMAPEGELLLSTEGEGSSVVHKVSFVGAPIPLGVVLAREKDVILFGFGSTLPEQSLALLRGSGGDALAGTERFRAAFKHLPAPNDSLAFIDTAVMLGQVRGLIAQVMQMADPTNETMDEKTRALPGKILDELDICEYIASVATTEGMKTTLHEVVVIKDGATNKTLYKAFLGSPALKDPLRYIPSTASNFSVWSGMDLKALYDGIITFIKNEVPDGANVIAQWDAQKTEIPFDLENDLLAAVGGPMQSFSVAGRSAYSPPDWAMLIGVKDEQKVNKLIQMLIDNVKPMLEGQQQGSIDDAAIDGAEGFKTVSHPMLMMIPGMAAPTFGVKDGYFYFSSSPKTIAAAIATSSGSAENISVNDRFKAESAPLETNVTSCSYTDLTRLGDELSQALSMVSMVSMFAPQIAQNPGGRILMAAATKAAKVVRKLDFFQSTFTQSTMDGNVARSITVTHYREPPKPAEAAPAGDGTSEGSGAGSGS